MAFADVTLLAYDVLRRRIPGADTGQGHLPKEAECRQLENLAILRDQLFDSKRSGTEKPADRADCEWLP